MNRKMESQYIGACALLARLSRNIKSKEDLASIGWALNDLCQMFPDRFEYANTEDGMFLFQLKKEE